MMFCTCVARLLAVGTLTVLTGSVAAQQSYPNRPIRFVSPNTPGGGTTILARVIGQKLTESWGQQVIVDNRPGGNGIIGGEAVLKSPPDGYTLMSITTAPSTLACRPREEGPRHILL